MYKLSVYVIPSRISIYKEPTYTVFFKHPC